MQKSTKKDLFVIERLGEPGMDTFRVFFKLLCKSGNEAVCISPFHDIPLFSNSESKTYHMVVEIPRWTNAIYKMAKKEPFNPIRQEVSKGVLKYLSNVFPYHGIIWNYGYLPQTWEMPSYKNKLFELHVGDNNPLDVIEIGSKKHSTGAVIEVKVLGSLAVLENGVLDLKVLAIDQNDPEANKLNSIADVDNFMPGLLEATVDWFQFHKTPNASEPITIGKYRDETFLNLAMTHDMIACYHSMWLWLVKNELPVSETKNCASFKLMGTQCVEAAKENLKSAKEAQETVEMMKQLLANRPRKMAKQPSQREIESSCFYDKRKSLTKINFERKESKLLPSSSFWNTIRKTKNTLLEVTVIGGLLVGLVIYLKHKPTNISL